MTVRRHKLLVNKTKRRTDFQFHFYYPEHDGIRSILLLVANGHQICIKYKNTDVRLRTSDDGQKGYPKRIES